MVSHDYHGEGNARSSATRGSKSIPGRPAQPKGGADLTTLEPLKIGRYKMPARSR
jgi:hypothetical protein